ncbi:hypothetical protein PV328_003315 [Microctonus aethiopoides]|uniref:Mannosyltransferase n=1 Tax=Microctonus aethiopoides TaxID=144406 RepID=A0AA39KKI6_9HYME|nr:hypothetical protein PV328_003315 [Microctonus aethiopoides]
MLMTRIRTTLKFFIIWRIISICVVQTYYVPDEYWQSLEIAHQMVFGYGYETWEWHLKIRSYVYPFLISITYKLLAILHLDYATLLIYIPRVAQAIVSGYADYKFFTWTKSDLAIVFLEFNWFWYYCATRTLTNTLETSLTMIALSIFPWNDSKYRNSTKFLWIVGFMCIIRPTSMIIWIPLCIYHIFITSKNIYKLFKEYLFISLCTLAYSILIDSYFYGEFTFTPWEFFKVNVLNNIANHYGTHNLFWYLTTGLPVVIGLPILYFPIAALHVIKHCQFLSAQTISLITITWTLGIYSFLPHKEFRFIMPLLPLFIFITTSVYSRQKFKFSESIKQILLLLFIISNILIVFYTGMVHQRGRIDAINMFRKGYVIDNPSEADVLFLMPCHSTPFYSHLHLNISMRFLSCEPNLKNQPNYLDEADHFFNNPTRWIDNNYNNCTLPMILMTYDNIVPLIETFLKNYQPALVLFNTHFPQSNIGENVVIYKRKF